MYLNACNTKTDFLIVTFSDNARGCVLAEINAKGRCLSRFFLGGNKVLQIALGKTDAEEQKEGLHKASEVCCDEKLIDILIFWFIEHYLSIKL